MYEFWYDYIKPKYDDRGKLCYLDTDSFVIHIKAEDFYEDITDGLEKWFDTSNYSRDDNRLLLIAWNEKKIGFFRDELVGNIMKEFVELRAKRWAYLMADDTEHKKAEGTKKCVMKDKLYLEIVLIAY